MPYLAGTHRKKARYLRGISSIELRTDMQRATSEKGGEATRMRVGQISGRDKKIKVKGTIKQSKEVVSVHYKSPVNREKWVTTGGGDTRGEERGGGKT